MNVLYIGGIPPIELQNKVKEWGSITDYPGYKFQSLIVKGLELYYPQIRVITTLWIQPFPKSKKLFFRRQEFSHRGACDNKDVFCGFLNLPIIKKISQYYRLSKELKRKVVKGEENIIISYALTSYSLLAILPYCRHAKTCIIVPDLPDFMSDSKNVLYRFAKKIDKAIINKCLKHIDSFVLLSELMRDKLPIKNKPYTIVEGICDKESITLGTINKNNITNHKVILYTGGLSRRYGILDLAQSIHRLKDKSVELRLYGTIGTDLLGEINDIAREDPRVKYMGVVHPSEISKLQQEAYLLVNPRHSNEEFTKYSFPSKTMEYMLSGTPVLMCKLASLPKEYFDFLFFFDDESIDGMTNAIDRILSLPECVLKEKGLAASNFVANNKDSRSQTGKIYKLINSISR